MAGEKNFIDFILDAKDDSGLLQGFATKNSAQKLKNFFEKNGYKGISKAECSKLIKAKKEFGFTEWPPPPAY
jgi:hypothetical protein